MQLPTRDPDSSYRQLPQGANMRVSIRRTPRVGALAGTPVEDYLGGLLVTAHTRTS